MKKITVLVPCYNEEAVVGFFYNRLAEVLDKNKQYEFEILFVDDGSRDSTLTILKALRLRDSRVSYVALSRNFGKEIAMIAGIDYIDSDAMVIIDADLQDPPELITEMLVYWEEGYKDVCTKRRNRDDESAFKRWCSNLYYKILQGVTRIPVQPNVGDFRLLDRQCIEALKLMRESQRYTKGMFSWIGFKKKEILFDPEARAAGTTKWSFTKLMNLAIEGLTAFTIAPLRIATLMGLFVSFCAFAYMVVIIVDTLLYGNDVAGYPSLITLILFMGGMQLTFLGVIGEYLGRVFNEEKRRPLYLVSEYNEKEVIKQKMV